MKPNQRVTAVIYGKTKTGTVTKHQTAIVWVLWDGEKRPSWHHLESLTAT